MAGVFFTLTSKRIDGSRDPDWKYVLLPSLKQSLDALSEGVRDQRPKYEAAIQRLADLRSRLRLHWSAKSSGTPIDSTEKFLEEVLCPYIQLVSDTRKYFSLPSDELPDSAAKLLAGSSPVPFLAFQWKNAFDSTSLTSGNVHVELCALLFNMGVMVFNDATQLMFSNADAENCRKGFAAFQQAAGTFSVAKEISDSIPHLQLSWDLMPNSFEMLTNASIAMAHRCAYLKASQEPATKENPALLSKIAMGGANFLKTKVIAEAERLSEGRGQVGQDFKLLIKNLKDNAALLEADAYFQVMNIEFQKNECGAVMAKGRISMHILTSQAAEAASPSNKQWLDAKCVEVRALHDNAQSFNNTVYFQRVPEAIDPLAALERPLGKPLAPFASDLSNVDPEGGQPFKGLVGPDIIPMLATFRDTITAEFGKLSRTVSDKREAAADRLSRLHLDVILCQSEEGTKPRLPESLRERVLQLQSQAASYDLGGGGGGNNLTPAGMVQNMLKHVANVCAAIDPVLDEATAVLDKEKQRDADYIHAYGEKIWRSRIKASSELPDVPTYRRKIADLRNIVNGESKEMLQGIVKVLNENAQPLLRVQMPVEDLDAMIPVSETPNKEQQEATETREKLSQLRQSFETISENEMSFMRAIPPQINSPDLASALCAAKKQEDREDVLSKKQCDFIDSFSGINSLAEQRERLLDEMEILVLQLAKVESDDPMFKEKAAVIKSVETGIKIVEGAVMRIADASQQVTQHMENANVLRQYCEQLAKAREVEARATSAQLDEQIKEQVKKIQQSNSAPPAAGYSTTAATSSTSPNQQQPQYQHQQQQQSPSSSFQQMQNFQQQNQHHNHHQQHQQQLAPPPPPPPQTTFGASQASGYNVPNFLDPTQQQQQQQQQQNQQQQPQWNNSNSNNNNNNNNNNFFV